VTIDIHDTGLPTLSMAFDVSGDLSFAKLCIKQLARAMRGPFTMEKAESARSCLRVALRDIELWIEQHAQGGDSTRK